MKIEQITQSVITADEGKLLKRKSDGIVFGDEVYLGYNYYSLGVAYSSPLLETPSDYEEIDKPLDYEDNGIKPDYERRINRINELILETRNNINTYGFTDELCLKYIYYFPKYEELIDSDVKSGFKFQYNNRLYEVLQDMKLIQFYEPSENTKEFYREIK